MLLNITPGTSLIKKHKAVICFHVNVMVVENSWNYLSHVGHFENKCYLNIIMNNFIRKSTLLKIIIDVIVK